MGAEEQTTQQERLDGLVIQHATATIAALRRTADLMQARLEAAKLEQGRYGLATSFVKLAQAGHGGLPLGELITAAATADLNAMREEAPARPNEPQVDDQVRVTYKLFPGRPEQTFTGTIAQVRSTGPNSDRPGRRFYVQPDGGQGERLAGWYSVRDFELLEEG